MIELLIMDVVDVVSKRQC